MYKIRFFFRSGEILVKFSSEPIRVVWEPEHLVEDLKQVDNLFFIEFGNIIGNICYYLWP